MDRIDQGERSFRFRIEGGRVSERLGRVEREALEWNEAPFALSFFTPGDGTEPKPAVVLSEDEAVVMTAFKQAKGSRQFVVRLFEPTGKARNARLELPALGLAADLSFAPFELKTILVDCVERSIRESLLLDELRAIDSVSER